MLKVDESLIVDQVAREAKRKIILYQESLSNSN